MQDYEKLRELLAKEVYPHAFQFKFIGQNTDVFQAGIADLEIHFPELQLQTRRLSSNQKYLSVTYVFEAKTPDSIVDVYKAIAKIKDITTIL